jgi:hypothetical protein
MTATMDFDLAAIPREYPQFGKSVWNVGRRREEVFGGQGSDVGKGCGSSRGEGLGKGCGCKGGGCGGLQASIPTVPDAAVWPSARASAREYRDASNASGGEVSTWLSPSPALCCCCVDDVDVEVGGETIDGHVRRFVHRSIQIWVSMHYECRKGGRGDAHYEELQHCDWSWLERTQSGGQLKDFNGWKRDAWNDARTHGPYAAPNANNHKLWAVASRNGPHSISVDGSLLDSPGISSSLIRGWTHSEKLLIWVEFVSGCSWCGPMSVLIMVDYSSRPYPVRWKRSAKGAGPPAVDRMPPPGLGSVLPPIGMTIWSLANAGPGWDVVGAFHNWGSEHEH